MIVAAHHHTERALIDSGLSYTILRHPFYTEAFINTGLRQAVESGKLVSGTGGRGLNTALRADLAEAAANVLTDDAHLGHGYDLTGPLWTYPQLADALGEVTGTRVEYHEATGEITGPMAFLVGLARSGALERQTDDLRHVPHHRHPRRDTDWALHTTTGEIRPRPRRRRTATMANPAQADGPGRL